MTIKALDSMSVDCFKSLKDFSFLSDKQVSAISPMFNVISAQQVCYFIFFPIFLKKKSLSFSNNIDFHIQQCILLRH